MDAVALSWHGHTVLHNGSSLSVSMQVLNMGLTEFSLEEEEKEEAGEGD